MTITLDTPIAPALRPLRAGALHLPNRLVMAPMTRNRAGDGGVPTAANATYYAQRASAGLVISEATAVAPDGFGAPVSPGLFTDDQEAGWAGVATAVHARGGRLVIQLYHAGRSSHPDLIGGAQPVGIDGAAPDIDIFTLAGPQRAIAPAPLDEPGRRRIITAFAHAAERAIRAGADGVEIQAGNGYLLDCALVTEGPRFALEVVEAVNAAIGAEHVGVRVSPGGTYNDIHDPAPLETLAALVDGLPPIAYLHVIERPDGGPSAVRAARSGWAGALIANGSTGLSSDDLRRLAALDGAADAISFGRMFLANPDFPERLRRGAELNAPDEETFYGGDARGYTDYPSLGG